MNIWKRDWFEWKRPFRTIKCFFANIKYSYQRIARGWADLDTWDLDASLAEYLHGTLHHLADTTHGWPQGPDFPEFEDWQKALHQTAETLYGAMEWNDKVENPYASVLEKTWNNPLRSTGVYINKELNSEREECYNKYLEWEKERALWREDRKNEAMAWITKYFFHLWD